MASAFPLGVALQRRLPMDDKWLNPHNPCLTMFSNASVHVLPFARALAPHTRAAAQDVLQIGLCATDHAAQHLRTPDTEQTMLVRRLFFA